MLWPNGFEMLRPTCWLNGKALDPCRLPLHLAPYQFAALTTATTTTTTPTTRVVSERRFGTESEIAVVGQLSSVFDKGNRPISVDTSNLYFRSLVYLPYHPIPISNSPRPGHVSQ